MSATSSQTVVKKYCIYVCVIMLHTMDVCIYMYIYIYIERERERRQRRERGGKRKKINIYT